MTGKIGLHLKGVWDNDPLDYYAQTGAAVVKFESGFGLAQEFKRRFPDTLRIGRQTMTADEQARYVTFSGDPALAAQAFFQAQKATYLSNPDIEYWEGPNEVAVGGPDDPGALSWMAWYGQFEAERLRLLDNIGLRGVVGCFSTGYPEIYGPKGYDFRMWAAFKPALDAAKKYKGLLGVHEYAGPWLWWWSGNYQGANCSNPSKWGRAGQHPRYLVFRYRAIHDYLVSIGLDYLPIVTTELGWDRAGGGCPGMPAAAWRDLTGWWLQHKDYPMPEGFGLREALQAGDAEAFAARQLVWANSEMMLDWYFLGGTVFTWGDINSTWPAWRIDNAPRLISVVAAELKTATPTPKPEPEPEPEPIPVRNLGYDWFVDDVAFWECEQEMQHYSLEDYPPAKDHRATIINWLRPRGTKINMGFGLVDILKPGGVYDDTWYKRVLLGDKYGQGLLRAGLELAVIMVDTVPAHMSAGSIGWLDTIFYPELRAGVVRMVNEWKAYNKRWAFWNEVDHNAVGAWKYAEVLRVFCDAVYEADPEAEVALSMPLVHPGDPDWAGLWVEAVLDQIPGGIPVNLKGMNIHPYDKTGLDGINRALFDRLAEFPLDFWVLEYGWSKDDLLPHWDDGGERLLRVQQMVVDRFLAAYPWMTTGPYRERITVISIHRLLDVPQAPYGQISIGVWQGNNGWAYLIENVTRETYAATTPPTIQEIPMDKPQPQIGQQVYVDVESGVNVLEKDGTQIGAASEGDVGKVLAGPETVKNAKRWYVDFGRRDLSKPDHLKGFVDGAFLSGVNAERPTADYASRGWVRVPADQGGFWLYTEIEPTLEHIEDPEFHGIGSSDGAFTFTHAHYREADNTWYFLIEGGGKFAGSKWIAQKIGKGSRQVILEVYADRDQPRHPEYWERPKPELNWPLADEPEPEPKPEPEPQPDGNLLVNPLFLETDPDGKPYPITYFASRGASGRMVYPWDAIWADKWVENPDRNPGHQPFGVPEIIDIDEKPDIGPFPGNGRAGKFFAFARPIWVMPYQDIEIAKTGEYDVSAWVFPDPVISYSPKVHPSAESSDDWHLAFEGRVALGIIPDDPNVVVELPDFSDGRTLTFGAWNKLTRRVTVTQPGRYRFLVDVLMRWPFQNNGFFLTNPAVVLAKADTPPDDEPLPWWKRALAWIAALLGRWFGG